MPTPGSFGRRAFGALIAGVGLIAFTDPAAAQTRPRADLLIAGGSLYDGTGAPPRIASIAITGDRIVWIGVDGPPAARRVIDAHGLVVAPGFIDPHSHSADDLSHPRGRYQLDYLMQGVTTVITGNDGAGPVDVGGVLARWEAGGIGTNVALLVGHGTVRGAILGMADRPPNAGELAAMERLVERGMAGGAVGLSSGLYYAPGSYAAMAEVVALARVAARFGGIYDSHIRDESSYTIGLLGAVAEAIQIGREAGLPVHIAHIKALGTDVWGQSDTVIALIQAARRSGVDVTADQYPYPASGTSIGAALLPRWAEAGGRDSLTRRLSDSLLRAKVVAEMRENLRRRGGADALLITSAATRAWTGKTLAALASSNRVDPIEQAIAIIRAGDAGVASFNMQERDIEKFMAADFVVTGSDGSGGHPRKYGTFPRKLREYVLGRSVIGLARAIRASSGQTADIFHLKDRGYLRPGAFADLVVLDSTRIKDEATYEAPERLATGVQYVVINGRIAVDRGEATKGLAGRALRLNGRGLSGGR